MGTTRIFRLPRPAYPILEGEVKSIAIGFFSAGALCAVAPFLTVIVWNALTNGERVFAVYIGMAALALGVLVAFKTWGLFRTVQRETHFDDARP